MTRHWVYWRSGIAGDERNWATLLDADGQGYTFRHLHPPKAEHHYSWKLRRTSWLRISKAEAERLAAAAQQKDGQP